MNRAHEIFHNILLLVVRKDRNHQYLTIFFLFFFIQALIKILQMRKQVTNCDLILFKSIEMLHMSKQVTHCDLASQN
jgi:hypothetical protein